VKTAIEEVLELDDLVHGDRRKTGSGKRELSQQLCLQQPKQQSSSGQQALHLQIAMFAVALASFVMLESSVAGAVCGLALELLRLLVRVLPSALHAPAAGLCDARFRTVKFRRTPAAAYLPNGVALRTRG